MIIMRKEGQNESKNKFYEEPCGRDRRASEIEYLFSVSFPLVGSPQRLAGARILPTCSGSQKRFWTSQNDRNKELRQRPQGVKFIKQWNTLGMVGKFDKATCRREYEK